MVISKKIEEEGVVREMEVNDKNAVVNLGYKKSLYLIDKPYFIGFVELLVVSL